MVLHSIHWLAHPSTTDLKLHHWRQLIQTSLSNKAKHIIDSSPSLGPRDNRETRRYQASSWILWMTRRQRLVFFYAAVPSCLFLLMILIFNSGNDVPLWFPRQFWLHLNYELFIMNLIDGKLSLRYCGSMGWYKFSSYTIGIFSTGIWEESDT